MRSPEQLRERLRLRWARRRGDWLEGGDWPLALPIAPPSEAEAQRHWPHFRQWLACWRDFDGPGRIEWQDRRWPRLGTQALPLRWLLTTPEEVAEALAEGARWRRAARRYGDLSARWPGHPALRERLRRGFDTLADLPDLDFERLLSTVDWLFRHPDSGLFARQLPIAGLDSKWLEAHRGVVADWLLALRARADDASASSLENDFHRITGLRPKPDLLRLRLLDPALRARLGGLDDVTAPVSSIAALHLPIRRALVVENLATGLAFHDLPGTVAFMALGYAVDALARIDWLRDLPIVYWGDLDSHGFAILDRLRARC